MVIITQNGKIGFFGLVINHIKISTTILKKDFFNGISVTIMECGRQLRTYFPHQRDDINELENHVTFEKDLK